MAELILTPEEIAQNSWLDLDDASLGRAVKEMGLKLIPAMKADAASRWDGHEALYLSSFALLVGMEMDEMGAAKYEFEIERTRKCGDGIFRANGLLKVSATIDTSPDTKGDTP